MRHAVRRRLAGAALTLALAAGPALAAAPAHADSAPVSAGVPTIGDVLRGVEVDWAEGHWNWTAWNDSTPVAFGADQEKYQCAEYVARALAAAGLVPGLGPDDPQDDYFHYTAPNGVTYDLLLISDLPQYHNLYDYLMDSHLGQDIGDHPEQARPGDVVVTYAGPGGTKSHTGLVVTAQDGSTEPTLDAHNRARSHYGYHYYAPSHLVRINPLGLLNGLFGQAPAAAAAAPAAPQLKAPRAAVPAQVQQDPAGPQV
ncbi:amidase domain-containing protein [Streptomyces tateyamensis]|uniref:amidase domain-containing protein n=1 Tax=Streptomyces tateyamensis TaxID=565073 RepID=UPI0015E88F2E|nr:amidase domain-containing protein [Streptomyces tateyamensis]